MPTASISLTSAGGVLRHDVPQPSETAGKEGWPSPRTTFAAICRMVVDETLRLPRPFLGGQIMTGRDRPDIAPTATVAPQRARFFGKGSQNPAIVASSNRKHHPRRGPYAQAYNRLSLARGQPACKTGDLPAKSTARIKRDAAGARRPIGRGCSIVLVERLIAVPEALECRPVLLEHPLQQRSCSPWVSCASSRMTSGKRSRSRSASAGVSASARNASAVISEYRYRPSLTIEAFSFAKAFPQFVSAPCCPFCFDTARLSGSISLQVNAGSRLNFLTHFSTVASHVWLGSLMPKGRIPSQCLCLEGIVVNLAHAPTQTPEVG